MSFPIKSPKKLIEVALPLDDINAACAYEKMPGIGAHPRGIHLWWARRPLAAARAVIFAQMVNDPGGERGWTRNKTKEQAEMERQHLFGIMRDLVLWENTNNEKVLQAAREEIWKSWRETCALNKSHPQAAELFNPDKLPAFHDPFAGGGAIPLEAQRLGLESYASDLNPVAVTINKAMIEIPSKFAGRVPVGPEIAADKGSKKQATRDAFEEWTGAKGLAEDVRRYGAWMCEEAQKRIGHLYPKIEVTAKIVEERPDLKPLVGQQLTVIAWLWARTVKSPNPAFSHVDVPLASSFVLSNKEGKEAYVEPVIDGDNYRFMVKAGKLPEATKEGTKASGRGANFLCLLSKTLIKGDYIKAEGNAGRMGAKLMAIVAEGQRGRVYLSPIDSHSEIAKQAQPAWMPSGSVPSRLTGGTCVPYGLKEWSDLFTPRQLVALTTFSDLVQEAIEKCHLDAIARGMIDDGISLNEDGKGVTAYAQAIGVYLEFAVDRCADFSNTCTRWVAGNQKIMNLYGKQAIAMTWDYPEAAILHNTVGGFLPAAGFISECLLKLVDVTTAKGFAVQQDATTSKLSQDKVVSTDPPYYDNIGYADLSDFFYVWLRKSLRPIFPNLYASIAVPKEQELVATSYRHGSKEKAEAFFLHGMTQAMHNLADQAHPAFPVTIYYAFKQSETKNDEGTSSTGWVTFLEAVLKAGFSLTGTWPMRSEQAERLIGKGTNALASSIILVCRKRAADAPSISRREFIRELNAALPQALDEMTHGGINSPIAPVDLSQAIIGPGMAIFSQYSAVLEADGKHMGVKTALQLINRFFAEDDFEHDTQFCLHWFESMGWAEGKYGDAEVLARAKGTSVNGLQEAGVIENCVGKVRLLKWSELPIDWNPKTDKRLPVWEALHHLIRTLNHQGETATGALLAAMPSLMESIRVLSYRLYTLCERKGWTEEARSYNELINAWNGIESAMNDVGQRGEQVQLDI
jgi:putative DNA methylase